MSKRFAVLPSSLGSFHERTSKSTLHEALLDLWLENSGLDIHPDDLTPEQLEAYRQDVERRAHIRRSQGKGATR